MEELNRVNFGILERLSMFSEFTPSTKIRIIMAISMCIIFITTFIVFFKIDFPKLKTKYFIWISSIVLILGMFGTFQLYPSNNLQVIYPNISNNQKIYKYGEDKYILKIESGKSFYVEDGHLRMVETE